jgi:hypothetical protein
LVDGALRSGILIGGVEVADSEGWRWSTSMAAATEPTQGHERASTSGRERVASGPAQGHERVAPGPA